MLDAVKQSVNRMTSHLQLISGYLEMEEYTKALAKTRETIKELHALATSLTRLANVAMTVPKGGAVVVPHGSTVVSYEDVNVDIDSEEARSFLAHGFGTVSLVAIKSSLRLGIFIAASANFILVKRNEYGATLRDAEHQRRAVKRKRLRHEHKVWVPKAR